MTTAIESHRRVISSARYSGYGMALLICACVYLLFIGIESLLLKLCTVSPPLLILAMTGNMLFFGLFIGAGLGIVGLFQPRPKLISVTGLALNVLLISAVLYMISRFS